VPLHIAFIDKITRHRRCLQPVVELSFELRYERMLSPHCAPPSLLALYSDLRALLYPAGTSGLSPSRDGEAAMRDRIARSISAS